MAADALVEHATELVHTDPRTRDIALFRSAEDVLRSVETHYLRPRPPPIPDPLRGATLETLRTKLRDPAGNPTAYGKTFGDFRNAVLMHEETCAQRLDVLRGTAKLLERLSTVTTDLARIQRMQTDLAAFLAQRWGIDLPLGSIDRAWPLRVSRRYDLLPPTWRTL